ncbi:hypothetical protein [Brachybacterium huguangmaarense]
MIGSLVTVPLVAVLALPFALPPRWRVRALLIGLVVLTLAAILAFVLAVVLY